MGLTKSDKIKIYLASDHAGFFLKEKIKEDLLKKNFDVFDFGADSYKKEDDYPDFVIKLARKVSKDKKSFGIILGGSGEGEAICANKISGIRAAVYYGGNEKIIKLSKEHNDSNVLSIGARFVDSKKILKLVHLWIKTPFSEDKRHKRRIKKFEKLGS